MASGQTLCVFTPLHHEPPTSNYAQLGSRNNRPTLEFDPSTAWAAVFSGILPRNYTGGGVTITLIWAAVSATSGNVRWKTSFERIQDGVDNLDSDSFATAVTGSSDATNGTNGVVKYSTISHTDGSQLDNLAAGERFRVKVERDPTVSSNMTGNAQLIGVELKET